MIKEVLSVTKDYDLLNSVFCEVLKIEFSITESNRDRIVAICKPDDVGNIEWSYERPGMLITYHISDDEYSRVKDELKKYIIENDVLISYTNDETEN
ncbi:hypothetical protein [Paenibacillus chitinolyticus]|uniref:hypothetical protein n=1 Tax=Paenibacillus chitinolyticus TaxID=79263 RepID=UPI001C48EE1A|nr:hypothetical protein [Paenibacillus chitinolyticus]